MSTVKPSVGTIDTTPTANPRGATAGIKPLAAVRLWPAVVFVALFWAFHFSIDYVELGMSTRFQSRFMFYGIILLLYFGWWMLFSRVQWKDRFLAVGVTIAAILLTGLLAANSTKANAGFGDKLFNIFMAGFPFALTFSTLWMFAVKHWSSLSLATQRIGLWVVIFLSFGFFDLVRFEGLDGAQHAAFAWRWMPTSEDQFMAAHAKANAEPKAVTAGLQLSPGDWPQFRGPQRDNQVHGLKLATDWNEHPPKLLWKQRIGPAWSSVIIVDGKLFTQEQRDDKEATVCYDAATGKELWAHEDAARFEESLSGAGPRGTPTFAEGKIYALGGTGKLNCLNAATGEVVWQHDIVADAEAEATPAPFTARQWGYSNSPLVTDGLVFVFAGGDHKKGLLVYKAETGEIAWTFDSGKDGYSSPQLATMGGQPQLLVQSNRALSALDFAGALLWELPMAGEMYLPMTQPQSVGDDRLLIQTDVGVSVVKASKDVDKWHAAQQWDSKSLKPSFNDYVVCEGSVYGFDDGVFCCLDLETGKRRWKAGRYGHGQVLLVADQPLLFIATEQGEGVLVRPNAEKLEELARVPLIEGKTWNHPVIAHGKLYIRNAEEMACYELPVTE